VREALRCRERGALADPERVPRDVLLGRARLRSAARGLASGTSLVSRRRMGATSTAGRRSGAGVRRRSTTDGWCGGRAEAAPAGATGFRFSTPVPEAASRRFARRAGTLHLRRRSTSSENAAIRARAAELA
jgi:hypothetical protein